MFIKHNDVPVVNGRLTQYGPFFRTKGSPTTLAVFECSCGRYVLCQVSNVKSGASKSCGCLQKELQSQRAFRHGKRHTKVYNTWCHVLSRCTNTNNQDYKYYGGRGITVAPEWLDFNTFYADMSDPPSPKHTIERKNNDQPYSANNCVWVLQEDQNRNKRNSRMITAFGKTQCLSVWARELGIPRYTLARRLNKGWSTLDALSIE